MQFHLLVSNPCFSRTIEPKTPYFRRALLS